MARTKQEIRNFINSKNGQQIVCPNNRSLDGQCVTFIKALLEFLGAPSPWKARGHAKDYGNSLVREGIALNHDGWLRICVNPSMGKGYGHIWIDLKDETNAESNGAKALAVTIGTRPINQAQQIITLDNYVLPNSSNSTWPNVMPQNGTFKASVDRNLRHDSPDGPVDEEPFSAGATQKYNAYTDFGNFRYVRWTGRSGRTNYVAVKRLSDKKRYGECY